MINFLETDALTIYNSVMNQLTDNVKEQLYPGDERRIYGEAVAMILVSVYNDMNDAAKQRLIRYARGEVLDELGIRVGVERLQPTPASDTFRFSVSEARDRNIVIPSGTRITQDGIIYFATDQLAILEAGNLYVDVEGTCLSAGEEYNDLPEGSITILVDKIPYISSVMNLYGTNGGDDGEAYTEEGDEKFRERIHLAPASFSVAGPKEAYKYYALSADSKIVDVHIDFPSACVVDIYPLMMGGELPSADVLTAVQSIFSDDIRPMTDKVTAKAPTQINYDINIKYYCTSENEEAAIILVESEGAAIDNYIDWQSSALGRDISPDALRRQILAPADDDMLTNRVERVDIISPVFKELSASQVAKFSGKLTVSHEVIGG